MNTEKPSRRVDLWSDAASWGAILEDARSDEAPTEVVFPSHVPEVFEAISGAWGEFDALTERLDGALTTGALIRLVHPVGSRTLRHLPDLVRYVDDRWPGIHGICFEPDGAPGDLPDLLPWWRSAVGVCVSREIPFVVGTGLPAEDQAGPRLRPSPPPAPPPLSPSPP